MSKFNNKKESTTKTINLAGGQAYKQSSELELVSILLTSFVEDTFYEKASENIVRLRETLKAIDPLFAAKAAIYARNEFGMRSITHVLASELAKSLSGEKWAKNFYKEIVRRPDDMVETIAYYFSQNNKSLSKSMQKGFSEAFGKFDAYQLAKYKMENKKVSLIDVVNLVHPTPTDRNGFVEIKKEDYISLLEAKLKSLNKNAKKNAAKITEVTGILSPISKQKTETVKLPALEALMIGMLKNTETTEAKMSKVGQAASNETEKASMKSDVWAEMLNSGKMPYFNLLRNLRNILEQAPDQVGKACELLTNEKAIHSSLVLPFRYDTAMREIENISNSSKEARQIMIALNKAVDISCANVPLFDGETLVVLDVSGSMSGKPSQIGGLFSAILVKSNNADFMTFDNTARYQNLNPADSVLTIAKNIKFTGGGTDFKPIFRTANKKYDRIIILSDMQAWVGSHTPTRDFAEYKKKFGCNPNIYSFDLAGHGSMQFPEGNVCAVAGFSEKIFDVIKTLEQDKNALIDTIKNYVEL
jgi:hypothetical protein